MVGELTLDVKELSIATRPDQHLITYIAPPGGPAAEALHFLLLWSGQRDDEPADRA
ncbi:hypothetical protein [Streptomyces sp. NPDC008139]|uniref:hypothetical protein n=1 Tax=Streptomyces sp. NPDC008139 TaxID=3364814 RepID=UPI0036F06B47